MGLNIIQMKERIDFYNDRSKSPRFLDSNYVDAINAAITQIFKDRTENEKKKRGYQFDDSIEQVMRELFSLVVGPVNIVPVGDIVPYPADYRFFGRLFTTVDGQSTYARPIPFKMEGPLLIDSFRKPKPGKTYYQELDSGFKVLHNGTSFTAASLVYLKYPATVSMGQPSDKITGPGNVATNTQYIVYDDCVYNGTPYAAGQIFTSSLATTLSSGVVIPTSVIVNCDMPDNIQDEICTLAAENMSVSVEDYNKMQAFDQKQEEA